MCIVAHGWAHGALWCAKGRRRVLCSSQHVFFMSQGEGREPGFRFQSFKFHVSIHFVPLSQGDEEQSSGAGMTNGKRKGENGKLPILRSPLTVVFLQTPPSLRAPSPSPDVRLGSLTLMRHKMTFSHFSKGFIRPNLGEESWRGFTSCFPFSVCHPPSAPNLWEQGW